MTQAETAVAAITSSVTLRVVFVILEMLSIALQWLSKLRERSGVFSSFRSVLAEIGVAEPREGDERVEETMAFLPGGYVVRLAGPWTTPEGRVSRAGRRFRSRDGSLRASGITASARPR